MTRAHRTVVAPAVRPAPDLAFRLALLATALVTLLRLLWLAGQPIDLYPDEAQYWIWAQHPDWGYYAKPPMVAWLIWATTGLLGESDLAVKAAAPLTYLATSLVVFALAARLYDRRIAAWSAVAFVTLPAVSLSAIIISTDVPLLFCWAVATYAFVRAREPDGTRWWLLVGCACGLGLLSKYAMGFWLGSALAFLLAFREERIHLRRFLLAALVALLIFVPNLAWNWENHFASFRAARDNAALHGLRLHLRPFAEFVLSQVLVFGPIFLGTLGVILARPRRALEDRRTALLLTFTVPTLAIMVAESALARAHPNWSAPAYVTATILVVAWLGERGREGLVRAAAALHVALAVSLLGAHDVAAAIGQPLPGKLDPLHRVRGWRILGHSVSSIEAENGFPPLLADDRELMAALIYYMAPHPFTMAMWNPSGGARNGFELTQSLPDRPDGDYLWITQRTNRDEVFARFERHSEVAHVLVPLGQGLAREVWVFRLEGFKGYR